MASDPFERLPELDAQRLRVEALGEPGDRRFRLLALIDGETIIVWLEKQQVQALGIAIDQMLEQLPEQAPNLGSSGLPLEFDEGTRRQFRVGRMELGYDERNDRFVIIAHDIMDDSGDARFRCRITRNQARELSVDSATVAAAGRPRCTMCGAPMGPGLHVCPQQNGHLPRSFADLAIDDDE